MENSTPAPAAAQQPDINDPKVLSNAFNALAAAADQFRGTRTDHELLQGSLQVIKLVLEKHIAGVMPSIAADKS